MIVRDRKEHERLHPTDRIAGEPCFYCGKPLGFPFILWTGQVADGRPMSIGLHSKCIGEWMVYLGSDCHQALLAAAERAGLKAETPRSR
jgi:hypothetical protein